MEGPSTANPPATLAEDRLLRPEQAAWYLNVKTSWVYEAVRAGRLPCHRVGRHIRFTRLMLDDWLAEQPRRVEPLGSERGVDLKGERSVSSAERFATSARLEDALGELDAPREDFQAEDERTDHADLSE
jgi:excisionase family DNA binding protein